MKKKVGKYLSAALAAALIVTSPAQGYVSATSSDEIKSRLESLKSENSSLDQDLSSAKSELNASKNRLEELNSKINNYSEILSKNKNEKDKLNGELEEVVESKNSVIDQIAALTAKINDTVSKIYELEQEIIDIEEKIKNTEARIDELEEQVSKNTKLLEERLVIMYKQGEASTVEILMASKDINDFLSRQTMMTTITKHDKNLIESLKSDKEELDSLKAELNGQKISLDISKENAEKEKADLEVQKKDQDDLFLVLQEEENLKSEEIDFLKASTSEYESYLNNTISMKEYLANELARKEKEIKNMEEQLLTSIGSVEKLESELKDVEEQERKERLESEAAERRAKLKEQEEAYKKKQDELKEIEQAVENQNAPQTPSTSSSSSGFTWPSASTYITSYYGWRYIFGSNSFHKGIDLAGPTGTAIYAAQDGVVTYTGYYGEYGNLIIIQHSDGYQTKYAHLSSYGVSTGQRVSKGQYIAGMGTTGLSTGPHLHFEILKDGSNRDPLAYLR